MEVLNNEKYHALTKQQWKLYFLISTLVLGINI